MSQLLRLGSCAFVLALANACIAGPSQRCLEETDTGACVSIVAIQPQDGVGNKLTSNVDAFMGTCSIVDPTDDTRFLVVAEPFTDHSVIVNLYNSPPVAAHRNTALQPVVTFDSYEVSFVVNACAPNAICPALDAMSFAGPTVAVRPDADAAVTLPLLPIRKKDEYVARGGAADAFGSYTAHIVLKGMDGEGSVRLEGDAEFTVGNYTNCAALATSN